LSRVSHQFSNDLGAAAGGESDSLQTFEGRFTLLQFRCSEFRFGQNPCQQVVEVVSDAACQSSDAFQLRSSQMFLLCSPGIGNVLTGAYKRSIFKKK